MMATKKNPEGDFSRREFIKTASAATAAASVGIKPDITHTIDPQPFPLQAWTITDKQILTMWMKIWPKIVALSWMNPLYDPDDSSSPRYRDVFQSSATFRKTEANRIASVLSADYNTEIGICLADPSALNINTDTFIQIYEKCGISINPFKELTDSNKCLVENFLGRPSGFKGTEGLSCPISLYGDTFFLINDIGFIMPWPNMDNAGPTLKQIFIGYYEGGGMLPRKSLGPIHPQQALIDSLAKPYSSSNSSGWQLPTVQDILPYKPQGVTGVALLRLFAKWPKTIASLWDAESQGTIQGDDRLKDIEDYLDDIIMPEVWSSWPNIVERPPTPATNRITDDITIQPIGNEKIRLTVPLPINPHIDRIFEELLVGYATNPMYSACY